MAKDTSYVDPWYPVYGANLFDASNAKPPHDCRPMHDIDMIATVD
jgi:hypothetical protein